MDTLTYAVETNTHRIVEVTWTGTRFQLVVYGAMFLTGVEIEWADTLAYAVHRFQFLVERNTKPVVDKSKLTFAPQVKPRDYYLDYLRSDWGNPEDSYFDLSDFE